MLTKERIKTHFRENKKVYLTGSVCLIVGAGVAFKFSGATIMIAKPIQTLNYKSTQVNKIYQLPQVSNLAKPVLDKTTNTPYLSQKRAAKALGASASQVSQHLNGKTPDVKGHVLEHIPMG